MEVIGMLPVAARAQHSIEILAGIRSHIGQKALLPESEEAGLADIDRFAAVERDRPDIDRIAGCMFRHRRIFLVVVHPPAGMGRHLLDRGNAGQVTRPRGGSEIVLHPLGKGERDLAVECGGRLDLDTAGQLLEFYRMRDTAGFSVAHGRNVLIDHPETLQLLTAVAL